MPPHGVHSTSATGEAALLDMATLDGGDRGEAVSAGPGTTGAGPAAAEAIAGDAAIPDVIGHYERIREIGRGGMGTVHLARDTRLGRRVALKLLRPGVGRSERFFLEARATARLQHEHIVVIHEVGEHRGAPYMVLEYLDGQPLRALLGQPLPARRAVELALPIARALAHAHAHGIVHRDLKPENVFVTDAGVIKVLDFGIAKAVGLPDVDAAQRSARRGTLPPVAMLTRDGAVVGTLLYMAPEQWAGQVDARADQYALGLMLWEMVAGRHPLAGLAAGPTRELAIAPLSEAVAGVPRELDLLVRRCLAPAPADRFPTTDALVEALVAASPARFMAPIEHGESPYPGLGAFRERDAARFFGRSHDVGRAVALLDHHALLAIVGPSGVGKSSLVRAGVIPALRALGPWESFTVRPGRQPLDALAAFLVESTTQGEGDREPRPDAATVALRLRREPGYLGAELRRRAAERRGRVILFVDQLEESYTLSADPTESAAFFDCLLGAADDTSSPVRVVLSLRSDFLDRVGSSPAFGDAVTRGLMLLRAPDRRQLEEALVGPAELAGYHFEDAGTVDAMLDALDGTAAALPLLQFAAGQLWEARDRATKRLTRAAYEAMGGITGLLASHADGVLTALGPEARTLARTCFLRLVTPERTRAAVDREDLLALDGDGAKVQALLDRLVDARLLVVQARDAERSATYELAHEALLACWPTLARWLDEGREHAGFLDQLAGAARQWDLKGRVPGLLWRGEAAADAQHFARHYTPPLPPREAAYLDAVLRLKRRARLARRWAVAAVIAVLATLVAGGGVALVRISAAEDEAVQQADNARASAERLRLANAELTRQVEIVTQKERERQAAERAAAEADATAKDRGAKLASAEGDLARTNAELEKALAQATADKTRAEGAEAQARSAQRLAEASASQERALKEQLKAALAAEQARSKELEARAQKLKLELR